jgi:uncharacterized protein YkwD
LRTFRGFSLPLLITILLLSVAFPVLAGSPEPGSAPEAPAFAPTLPTGGGLSSSLAGTSVVTGPYKSYVPQISTTLNSAAGVNISSRQSVLDYYNQVYLGNTSAQISWTGSQSSCVPGTTSAAFRDAVLQRINYFRAMAGVPANVTFSDASNLKAQAAALMMSANGQLSHSPDTSWKCYTTEGATGAGSSDLYLGSYSWNAISGYMLDPGSGNSAAGHRRWILYPQTQVMGTGDIPTSSSYYSANALVVFDTHYSDPRPTTRDGFVAWPPPGYVPYPIVYARWSFSYPSADFSAAAVTMTSNGASVSLAQSAVANGYGENTLVWIPLGMSDSATWSRPSADTSYNVTVSNVKIGGVARSFSYTVTIFAP